jgi:hypothetical protein
MRANISVSYLYRGNRGESAGMASIGAANMNKNKERLLF